MSQCRAVVRTFYEDNIPRRCMSTGMHRHEKVVNGDRNIFYLCTSHHGAQLRKRKENHYSWIELTDIG